MCPLPVIGTISNKVMVINFKFNQQFIFLISMKVTFYNAESKFLNDKILLPSSIGSSGHGVLLILRGPRGFVATGLLDAGQSLERQHRRPEDRRLVDDGFAVGLDGSVAALELEPAAATHPEVDHEATVDGDERALDDELRASPVGRGERELQREKANLL